MEFCQLGPRSSKLWKVLKCGVKERAFVNEESSSVHLSNVVSGAGIMHQLMAGRTYQTKRADGPCSSFFRTLDECVEPSRPNHDLVFQKHDILRLDVRKRQVA